MSSTAIVWVSIMIGAVRIDSGISVATPFSRARRPPKLSRRSLSIHAQITDSSFGPNRNSTVSAISQPDGAKPSTKPPMRNDWTRLAISSISHSGEVI